MEVGTGLCGSLGAWTRAGCEVWTCDTLASRCECARQVFPKANVICGTSRELVRACPSADIAFIDGLHNDKWVRRDFEAVRGAAPLVLFHDATFIEAVASFCEQIGAAVLPTERGLGVWCSS